MLLVLPPFSLYYLGDSPVSIHVAPLLLPSLSSMRVRFLLRFIDVLALLIFVGKVCLMVLDI